LMQRQTVLATLIEPNAPQALANLRNLPGVTLAEPNRIIPSELSGGNHTRRINVVGLPARAVLSRVIDANDQQITLPPHGIVLSKKLADVLNVKLGDPLRVRALEGRRTEFVVPVAAMAEDFAGTAAYMQIAALNRALGEGARITGANLSVADA